MRLIQFRHEGGARAVAALVDDGAPRLVLEATTTRELVLDAHRGGRSLEATVRARGVGAAVDYDALIAERRLLVPLDHPDPARTVVALTGLTHLGSAQSRDSMHARLAAADLTDSMKMFKLGVEGGKPAPGAIGVQPEWAYKGDGSWLVAPEQPLEWPAFGDDGGEEAEIAGLYVIGDGGEVLRAGFALANEFSDHVMERQNYLLLAHSKLRTSSFGPELLVGPLPPAVEGTVRITRGDATIWDAVFLSGDDNMCHSIANLEQHHFKYARFRRPGDVHVYYFGASALSCTDRIKIESGDRVEIAAAGFGRPLRNTIMATAAHQPVSVVAL